MNIVLLFALWSCCIIQPNVGGSLGYWFTWFHFLATFILGVHPITGSVLEHSIGSSNNLVVTPGIVLICSWNFWKLYVLYKSEDSALAGHQQNPILQASSILHFAICLQCLTYSSTSPYTTLTVSLIVLWGLWATTTLNWNVALLSLNEFSGQSMPIYHVELDFVLTTLRQNGPAWGF